MGYQDHRQSELATTRKLDPAVPVYHAKFADIMAKIRVILKDYQHEMKIVQNEKGGVATSAEITITLTK